MALADTNSRQRINPLRDLRGCRTELARLYKAMRRGQLDTQEGYRMARVVQMVAEILKDTDLEARLRQLEEKASGQRHR